MRWQYRTVVFELQKDGLLGDRFIDDEEVEKTLNEQGRAGWELVSATMVQEGLLTLFKRPDHHAGIATVVENSEQDVETDLKIQVSEEEAFSAEELKKQEREHIRELENQRRQVMAEEESFLVGDIKIR